MFGVVAIAAAALCTGAAACSDADDVGRTAAADSASRFDSAGVAVNGSAYANNLADSVTPQTAGSTVQPEPDGRGGDTSPGSRPEAEHTDSAGPAANAADPGARILKRAAAKYAGIRTMSANFALHTENPLLKTAADSKGKLYQQQPDRIALRFTDPPNDVILSDGEFFWFYTPSSMPGQAFRTPAGNANTKAVDLQAQFVGDPVERFRYTVVGTERVDGRETDVLLLMPRQREPYRTLKVWVDRGDALVRRFEFTEQSGVSRHIDLTNVQINAPVPASMFRFTPPAGVQVVEQ
jgi:outer membrane lipoprotein carrier protein